MAASGLRVASMMEDPSRRRVNGGGRLLMGLNLSAAGLPEVVAALHDDFTPVTASNPARSGEVVILRVKAGWPAQPPLQAGQAFPPQPLSTVPIPVELAINDTSGEIINLIGWPGTRDFRVDVRLPGGWSGAAAKLQVSGGYLPGAVFNLPVQ